MDVDDHPGSVMRSGGVAGVAAKTRGSLREKYGSEKMVYSSTGQRSCAPNTVLNLSALASIEDRRLLVSSAGKLQPTGKLNLGVKLPSLPWFSPSFSLPLSLSLSPSLFLLLPNKTFQRSQLQNNNNNKNNAILPALRPSRFRHRGHGLRDSLRSSPSARPLLTNDQKCTRATGHGPAPYGLCKAEPGNPLEVGNYPCLYVRRLFVALNFRYC